MRSMKLISIFVAVVLGTLIAVLPAQAPQAEPTTLFEGARLIRGDGGVPIEDAAFVVRGNTFIAVGKRGAVTAPAGANRIDVSGKTVIPALIDAHAHPGYVDLRNIGAPERYLRERLVDHMQRSAYYGIAAVMSMGVDRGEVPYELRANPVPGAALFRTAGRGIAMPNGGPTAPARLDAPLRRQQRSRGPASGP